MKNDHGGCSGPAKPRSSAATRSSNMPPSAIRSQSTLNEATSLPRGSGSPQSSLSRSEPAATSCYGWLCPASSYSSTKQASATRPARCGPSWATGRTGQPMVAARPDEGLSPQRCSDCCIPQRRNGFGITRPRPPDRSHRTARSFLGRPCQPPHLARPLQTTGCFGQQYCGPTWCHRDHGCPSSSTPRPGTKRRRSPVRCQHAPGPLRRSDAGRRMSACAGRAGPQVGLTALWYK